MKTRSGFVSNSSSSSYVLAYKKDNVITDPKILVEYLEKEPQARFVIKGWDLGEGDDIFLLTDEHKAYIRRFSEQFIKRNEGLVNRERYSDEANDWISVTEPYIYAYLNADVLYPLGKEDLSDVEKEAKKNGCITERVEISNRSSSGVSDFLERYVVNEDVSDDDRDFLAIRRFSKTEARPYAVFYKTAIIEKESILDFLHTLSLEEIEKHKLILTWCNPIYNTVFHRKAIDFFYLGKPEIDILYGHKNEFCGLAREIVLFTEATVLFAGAGKLPPGIENSKITLGYGTGVVFDSGKNIIDFTREIITGESPLEDYDPDEDIEEDE